jgi:NADH dehydrogenase
LPSFTESLSQQAKSDLEKLGVEVILNSIVTDIDDHRVHIGDRSIDARTVFWAAGNQASPLAESLNVPLDRAGRVLVNPDLSVPGHPEIFVVGDLAAVKRPDGSWVPSVAQGGIQGGNRAGKNIVALIRGRPTKPFRYINKGELATIGRNRAIAELAGFTFSGYPAWVLWLFIHILYLVGFRNRVSVLIQWAYAYFTFQRGVRLITEAENIGPPVTGEWQVLKTPGV